MRKHLTIPNPPIAYLCESCNAFARKIGTESTVAFARIAKSFSVAQPTVYKMTMEARAEELLQRPDEDLFAHGGCHIFAQVLHAQLGHPLVLIRNDEETHCHVACEPEKEFILDVFGWRGRCDYIEDEGRDLDIAFSALRLEELERRLVYGRGPGFYAHKDFIAPASERARKWIAVHHEYFDGSTRHAIPNISRRMTASKDELREIFSD